MPDKINDTRNLLEEMPIREIGEANKGGWESQEAIMQVWPWMKGGEQEGKEEGRKEVWMEASCPCAVLRQVWQGCLGFLTLLSEDSHTSWEWDCLSISAMLSHWLGTAMGSRALVQKQWRISESRGQDLQSIMLTIISDLRSVFSWPPN